MKVLSRREVDLVATLAQTFFPEQGGVEIAADEARVVHYVDRFLASIPRMERMKMRALFQVFEYGIAITQMNPRARFTASSQDDREAYLGAWESSSMHARRAVFQALRSALAIAYFSDQQVQERLGMCNPEEAIRAQLAEVVRVAPAVIKSGAPAANTGHEAPLTGALVTSVSPPEVMAESA